MSFFRKLGQKGQTAVEYILLLMVVVAMITTLAKKVNEYFALQGENCDDSPDALVCQFKKPLGEDFRFFTLMIPGN